jgi:hypothetical protein
VLAGNGSLDNLWIFGHSSYRYTRNNMKSLYFSSCLYSHIIRPDHLILTYTAQLQRNQFLITRPLPPRRHSIPHRPTQHHYFDNRNTDRCVRRIVLHYVSTHASQVFQISISTRSKDSMPGIQLNQKQTYLPSHHTASETEGPAARDPSAYSSTTTSPSCTCHVCPRP